jgi:O-antigen ligase
MIPPSIGRETAALFVPLLFATPFVLERELAAGSLLNQESYFVGMGCALLAVLAGWHLWRGRDVILRVNVLDGLLVAFFGYVTLRLLLTPRVPVLHPAFIILALLLGVYFYFKSVLAGGGAAPPLHGLLVPVLGAGLLQNLYGGLQGLGLTGGFHPVFALTGSFINPAPFAAYSVCGLLLAAGVLLPQIRTTRPVKYLAWGVLVSSLLVLPFTQSRAAWLAAGVGLLGTLNYRLGLCDRLRARLSGGLASGLALLGGLVLLLLLAGGLYHFKPHSADGRLFIWGNTLALIGDHPWWGVGFGGFAVHYDPYQAASLAAPGAKDFLLAGSGESAFNEFLRVTAEFGLPGLLFLLLLTGFLVRVLRQHSAARDENAALTVVAAGSLLAVLVLAFFSYPFSVLPVTLHGAFLAALLSSRRPGVPYTVRLPRLAAVVGLGLAGWLGTGQFNTERGHRYWEEARRQAGYGHYAAAGESFARAHPFLGAHGRFLYEYGSTLSQSGQPGAAVPLLERARALVSDTHLYIVLGETYARLGRYRDAERHFRHAARLIPHKFYPKYRLVQFYRERGNTRQAIALAREIDAMRVKVHSDEVVRMKTELSHFVNQYDQ